MSTMPNREAAPNGSPSATMPSTAAMSGLTASRSAALCELI